MRKPLIAGNWKMHGSAHQVQTLISDIKQKLDVSVVQTIEVLVLPTFVHLILAAQCLQKTSIALGAQNLYVGAQGAFTGEVSGSMLKELGCSYVLVGHSERRTLFRESLELVSAKFQAALAAGLKPILCVGETQAERERGETQKIIREQVQSVLDVAGTSAFGQGAVIAYEPVWAIGTGLTASPEQAQEVHAYIRSLFMQNNVDLAKTIRILYGGSLKADNAPALFAMPDIDGGLIGGASLDAASFVSICDTAYKQANKSELTT